MSDSATTPPGVNLAQLATFEDAWEAGRAWAQGLSIGDTFRGSHGEADHRGLTGLARSAFGAAAFHHMPRGIWTNEAGQLTKVQR